MSTPIEAVVERLRQRGEVKARGKGWRCLCPAHDDTSPSLDVDEGSDHRVLLLCRSRHCPTASIAAALGLSMRDLFNGSMPDPERLSFDERILATYDYTDEAGKLLFQAVRLWAPAPRNKDFRQRRPDGKGGWVWKLEDTRRVLYHLPQLLAAALTEPVFVVEGEKDVHTLERCGLVATTNPMGAGKWRSEFAESLKGRDVVILPDNDDVGRKHAEDVRKSLLKVASHVRVVELDGLPEKGDVTDWVKDLLAGQGSESPDYLAVGRELREYATRSVTTEPPKPVASSSLPILYFDEVQPVLDSADFVEGLLIREGMSVIYGESNTGKTFFALDLALHIAAGSPWRDREVERGGVLYLALEGSHGIRNRVSAFKLAHSCSAAALPFAIVPVSVNLLDPASDTDRVIEAVRVAAERMQTPVSLVVVDTLSRALSGGNENSPEDMGALVANADRIRQTVKAHVMFIHHSGKDAARGARGHSLLRAATDTEVEVASNAASRTSIARVTKQRELDAEDGEFGFRLEKVTLGIDRRGKPVTSCVVREDDLPSQPDSKLAPGSQIALDALVAVIKAHGRKDVPGVPDNVVSIPESWWRERVYKALKGNEAANQKAFVRARKALLSAGKLGENNERVWLNC